MQYITHSKIAFLNYIRLVCFQLAVFFGGVFVVVVFFLFISFAYLAQIHPFPSLSGSIKRSILFTTACAVAGASVCLGLKDSG